MITIGMVDKVAPAVGKMLEQESKRDRERHTSNEGGKTNLDNYSVGEDGFIAKRVANGHIAIQSHKHEHSRLHGHQHVDEKHLHKAGIKVDLFETEPKDT